MALKALSPTLAAVVVSAPSGWFINRTTLSQPAFGSISNGVYHIVEMAVIGRMLLATGIF